MSSEHEKSYRRRRFADGSERDFERGLEDLDIDDEQMVLSDEGIFEELSLAELDVLDGDDPESEALAKRYGIKDRSRAIREQGRFKEEFSSAMRDIGAVVEKSETPVLEVAKRLFSEQELDILIGACSKSASGDDVLPYRKKLIEGNLDRFYFSFLSALEREARHPSLPLHIYRSNLEILRSCWR